MNQNHFSPLPAAIGMAGLVALALVMTSAAAAEPEESAPKAEQQETIIIKMVNHEGKPGEHSKEHVTKIMADCGVDKATIDTESESKDADGKIMRSRIVICNQNKGLDNATLVKRLEEARSRVTAVTELSGEAKAKALASLDVEIERLKSGK